MPRELLTLVVPLVLPTVAYLLWLQVARTTDGVPWRRLPWVWLAVSGVALTVVVLFVVTVGFGTTIAGIYVPPRFENGRIMPGHIVPETKP